MPKMSCFRGPFNKRYGKAAHALFKSVLQHLYHIDRLLPKKLSCKKSLLLTCKILGLLVTTLAPNEMYLVLNKDNLTIEIHMQVSEKLKGFSQFFAAFLKCC